jgi:thiamine-monophosphate kinase
MPLTEFQLIGRYFSPRARSAVLGVGDDAAILRPRRGRDLVVTTDMLVAGRHFAAEADPRLLGHKALAVNLSDVAAMGATPRWATLSVALPRVDARWIGAFSRGFLRLARRHGVELVGGDTTRGPLAICVQIVGDVPTGKALRRDGARIGDDVWVSGTLGDAAAVLAARRGRLPLTRPERTALARRLDAPQPRIALGERLRGIAHSAIDISDGLLADLGHICERSGVAAIIELGCVPCRRALARRLDHAAARAAVLAGGDDYELCFTAASSRRPALSSLGRRLRLRLTRIGCIVRARPGTACVQVIGPGGAPLNPGRTGYDHFG